MDRTPPDCGGGLMSGLATTVPGGGGPSPSSGWTPTQVAALIAAVTALGASLVALGREVSHTFQDDVYYAEYLQSTGAQGPGITAARNRFPFGTAPVGTSQVARCTRPITFTGTDGWKWIEARDLEWQGVWESPDCRTTTTQPDTAGYFVSGTQLLPAADTLVW